MSREKVALDELFSYESSMAYVKSYPKDGLRVTWLECTLRKPLQNKAGLTILSEGACVQRLVLCVDSGVLTFTIDLPNVKTEFRYSLSEITW